MDKWNMLTLVGRDKPGIVAKITSALFANGAQLGEASMMRLGGNFTIMLMVKSEQDVVQLEQDIAIISQQMNLTSAFQAIDASLHQHKIPDTKVTVYCADRPGIVAKVTTMLLMAGFDIMDLDSDVAGSESEPIYIMQIEGLATHGIEKVEQAITQIKIEGVTIDIAAIDVLIS
jgi:glycine cleavage system transcriptional repressor